MIGSAEDELLEVVTYLVVGSVVVCAWVRTRWIREVIVFKRKSVW